MRLSPFFTMRFANRNVFVGLFVALGLVPGSAADLGKSPKGASAVIESSVPDVPGDEIFGFTSPSDVGKPGDTGLAIENSGRAGKRDGSYGSITSKVEFSRTFAENWWIAGSFFNTWHRSVNVTAAPFDHDRIDFDGISTEIVHRIIERSASNPIAVSLSFEPRWARVEPVTGIQRDSFTGEVKLFADAVVIPDTLYWGFNLNWAPAIQQSVPLRSQWVSLSGTNISTALTYQIKPNLLVGGELRWEAAFNKALFSAYAGQALYLGPTLIYKVTDKLALNVVWTPQIEGHAVGAVPGRLDLDNFERQLFRAKLVMQF